LKSLKSFESKNDQNITNLPGNSKSEIKPIGGFNTDSKPFTFGQSNTEIKPIGNYAIAFVFSDGHNTGIYSWDLLYKLGSEYEILWADYLHRLEIAGHQRVTQK